MLHKPTLLEPSLEIALRTGKPGSAHWQRDLTTQVRKIAALGPAREREAGRELGALGTCQGKTGCLDRRGSQSRQGIVVGQGIHCLHGGLFFSVICPNGLSWIP